jgi:hypothetical protein
VLAHGFGDGFGFGVDLKFLVDVLEMERDGVKRNAHFVRGGLFMMTFLSFRRISSVARSSGTVIIFPSAPPSPCDRLSK